MIFTSLLTSMLFATTTFSAPNGRATSSLRTRVLQQLHSAEVSFAPNVSQPDDQPDVQYTTNWAGAIFFNNPPGTYNEIVGTFTIPTLSGPNGAAGAFVGIDGGACQSTHFHTGVTFEIRDGQVHYTAWYEWLPDQPYNSYNININAGDVIRLTASADITTMTSGTALIENLTNGQTMSRAVTSSVALCGQDGEWIVESFESSNSPVPFPNFGTVDFTDGNASGESGSDTPDFATLLGIQKDGQILTSVSADFDRPGISIQRL